MKVIKRFFISEAFLISIAGIFFYIERVIMLLINLLTDLPISSWKKKKSILNIFLASITRNVLSKGSAQVIKWW